MTCTLTFWINWNAGEFIGAGNVIHPSEENGFCTLDGLAVNPRHCASFFGACRTEAAHLFEEKTSVLRSFTPLNNLGDQHVCSDIHKPQGYFLDAFPGLNLKRVQALANGSSA